MSCRHCGDSGLIWAPDGSKTVARATACKCCARCGGDRTIYWTDRDGIEWAANCPDCKQPEQAAKRINSARLPARYTHTRLAEYRPKTDLQQAAFEAMMGLLATWAPGKAGVWLWGSVGTGKSQLMAVVLRELAVSGAWVRWAHVATTLADLRDAYDRAQRRSTLDRTGAPIDEPEGEDVLARLRAVPLLGLDDLLGDTSAAGLGLRTAWEHRTVADVVEARYQAGVTLCVTSNAEPAALGEALGERVVSRLEEMCRVYQVDGPDGRARAQQALV